MQNAQITQENAGQEEKERVDRWLQTQEKIIENEG